MPTRRGLGGSPSRDSCLGDGRVINGDGLSHRSSFLLRRGGIAHFRLRRHTGHWTHHSPEPASQAVTLARGAEDTLDFGTCQILTAFAKSVSSHSYRGRMKSDCVWIARPLRSLHFRP